VAVVLVGILALGVWSHWVLLFGEMADYLGPRRWLVLGWIVFLALWLISFGPRKWRQNYEQRKDFHGGVTLNASEAGIESRTSLGHAISPWSHFRKWKKGKDVFLLYFSNSMFLLIPKRFFQSDDSINEFRALLSSKVTVQ
jgi:YcxB-like protein